MLGRVGCLQSEKKRSGDCRKEAARLLSHRGLAPRARPSPRPRPQALEGAPALPSLQTQEPSMGEQAMAFSQAQRAEQLTP